ncbi:hypothetical protein [Chlorogloea sp. CCALA 695]|uniref:hypothetical protein n=1 Tax=Chlorogloea sp. CCALA 695 TaxID=2107693 RepID=UPI000D04AA6F|nr:hypothetical protein [Chlorogloea sp. CCALA 695]PSB28593.1 hypothetical protein C7B70_20690 [Chlorogloea sp. CCALA 695]
MKKQHPFYEILAKEIAYVFDNPEFENPVDEFLHPRGYILDQSFDKPNTGLRAFGLLPITAQKTPILVFGGSSKAIDDIRNDHPKGIGFKQFIENRHEIAAWLFDITQATRQKPNIVGHALGGAIAQIVATELIDWVGEVITFSSPGTSREIATQFVQNGGANLSVTHYIIDGDIISLAGEAFIAGTAIVQCFTECAIKPFYNTDKPQTIGRLLSNPPLGFTQTEISVNALNHPAFTFFSPDYLEFLAAYYAINPEVALCLTSRGKFEALRQSGFSLQKISC